MRTHALTLVAYLLFAGAPAFAQEGDLPPGHEGETAEEHAAHEHEDEHHDEHGDDLPPGHEGETAEEHAAHSHGEHEHEEHDDHAHESHGGLDVLQAFKDPRFLITCLTFFFLFLLIRFGYKKAGAPALQNRRREIEEALADAQQKKAEAEALRKEYRDRLDKMEDELARIRQEMINAGEADRDRIVAEAETKAATMRKDVEFQISQKMKQLRDDLTSEAASAAIAAAEAVITAEAMPSDQSRLAEDYLQNIATAAKSEETRA